MVSVNQACFLERLSGIAKRGFDIVFAFAGITILAPVMLLIAAAIKVSQSGSVIYRGERTGQHGKPFSILKFRSMVTNAESIGGTTTGRNDPRVTHVGKFLRRFKLDELPQFFNVLIGEMSFVGPRPEVAEYTDRYTDKERRILSVRPGITDLASLEFSDLQEVVGAASPDETFRANILPRKNQLRLQYVDEQTFSGDMAILFQTVAVVASKPFRKVA